MEAQALSLFFILTLRILVPRVFGYEVEHFVLCMMHGIGVAVARDKKQSRSVRAVLVSADGVSVDK